MGWVFLFVFQLVVLFLLSRRVTRRIYLLLYRWTKSKMTTAYLFSILFLPGIFVHEMSHFLMALLLFVPVGQLELMPEYKEERLKLGSVPISKTDPVRRFFIGVAPFIFGVGLMLSMLYMAFIRLQSLNPLVYLLIGYVLFSVSNTMYSSKKDLEGMIEFLGLFLFGVILVVVLGVRFSFPQVSYAWIDDITVLFRKADLFLAIPLLIDMVVILLLRRK